MYQTFIKYFYCNFLNVYPINMAGELRPEGYTGQVLHGVCSH